MIGGGKSKPTGRIDIALMQSLCREGEVNALVEDYGHIVRHPALLRMWERCQRGYQARGYRVIPKASGLFDPDD